MNDSYNFGSCSTKTNNKIIVLKEKQSSFEGKNIDEETFLKVKIDNCLNFNGKKCDFLLIRTADNSAFFIELKGHQLSKAIEQLANTINQINSKNKFLSTDFSDKKAFIVLTRSPSVSADIQKIIKEFKKNFNTSLKIKNRKISYNLNARD